MTYATKLQYAGSDPYQPEADRDDISYEEYELLTQDETYQRLAQVRWLASEAESELCTDDLVDRSEADRALFAAVATRDAPLQQAVDRYVAQWLAEHRADDATEEVSADPVVLTHRRSPPARRRGGRRATGSNTDRSV